MRFLTFLLLLLPFYSEGQIAVDGLYNDWKIEDLAVEDIGDNNDLDITKVWVSNDADNLYIRIDTDREIDIQDAENISVLIDADNNENSGFSTNGLGAEITYYFGNREGFLNYATDFASANHADLGLIALPTVTSSSIELSFKRTPSSNLGEITMSNTISIAITNGSNGDNVPNTLGGFNYTMKENQSFKPSFSLTKMEEHHTRIMSYNIKRDGFLKASQKSDLEAVITAVNPDIIAFQEVYDTPLSNIQNFLEDALPIGDGKVWDFAKEGPDVVVFTKGIVQAHDDIDGNGVFFMSDADGANPLVLYNVHLPCCDKDVDRQREIDRIMSVIRDKGSASEINFTYPDEVPFIIAGDFNLVGKSQDYKTFIEGDIVQESTYGADFSPDWDGSVLEDANPYITGFPSNYTWKNDDSSYNPGKLDFVIYSGSVLTKQNSFVLASEFLSDEDLIALDLNATSTSRASDHHPVIIDFTFGVFDNDMDGFTSDVDCDDTNADINPDAIEIPNNDIDEDCSGTDLTTNVNVPRFAELKIFPNPATETLQIINGSTLPLNISIYQVDGRILKKLSFPGGNAIVDVSNFQSGLYMLRIVNGENLALTRSFVKI